MATANSIASEIKESFRKGSVLTKLIYINLGVFVLVGILFLLFFLLTQAAPYTYKRMAFDNSILSYVMVNSSLPDLLLKPWSILTYMFLHTGFFHLLFNIIMLYWFGRLYQNYFTDKQLLTTYFLGGISGAALYILAYNFLPAFQHSDMLGASAAVTAIVFSVCLYAPNQSIRLFFIGEVKLKYIALFYVVLDVLQIAGDNPGGHIAHLGGALYGYFFAMQIRKGKDSGKWFSNISDWVVTVFKPGPKMKVAYKNQARNMSDEEYNHQKAITQKEIDSILDKIAKSGYDSLSKKEKETLFKMSNKS